VVEELHSLGVRHVLSHRIVQELMTSSRGPDANHRLHSRVTLLPPPLPLSEDLSWDILLADGPMQGAFSHLLRDIDDKEAGAHSLALIADRNLSPEQQQAVEAAHEDLIPPLGNEHGESNPGRVRELVEGLVANLLPFMEMKGMDPRVILEAVQSGDPMTAWTLLEAIDR